MQTVVEGINDYMQAYAPFSQYALFAQDASIIHY